MKLYSMLKPKLRQLMPKTIRRHRIWQGPIRGLYIVTSWHDYPAAIIGRTERPLLEWFGKNVLPGETWLDVGAHYGYTAMALCRFVGVKGRVFAFEPVVHTAGCLAQARMLNGFSQLRPLPIALGAVDDVRLNTFSTVRAMVDNTIFEGESEEAILVTQLDWLWPKICGVQNRIDGVKIDVQGMEIEAISGMANSLKEFRPKLVVEVHRGVDRDAFLSVIEAVGYARSAMPIEPIAGEIEAQFVNDRSYVFRPV